MEIDFLGLNSSPKLKQENPHIDAAGGGGGGFEISLSLSSSTGSSLNNFSETKKWESAAACTGTTPPLFRPAAAGFLYDAVNLRNMSSQRTCHKVFTEQNKLGDQNEGYMSGNSTTRDYTPTVAMARRATLARFLEKRLHRLNHARIMQGTSTSCCNSHSCQTTNNI